MNQVETLIETGAQFRRSQPDGGAPDYEEVGRELRVLQQLRSWLKCRHTHQDHCDHQSALKQPHQCAQETVKTAESGVFHNPPRKPGGNAKQEHGGKKNDQKAENIS